MSRFYASIDGGRSEATRQGHNYINGHVRGWNLGVGVSGRPARENTEQDSFTIAITGGSGRHSVERYFAHIVDTPKGRLITMDEQFGGAVFLIKPSGQIVRKRKVREAA